jgi:hypothetical protein
MIRFKSTVILLTVFLALLAVVVFYANDGADKKRSARDQGRPLLSTLSFQDVTEITLTKSSKEPVILQRDDVDPLSWRITEELVEPKEMDAFLNALTQLPMGKRVSKNSDSWEGYGLLAEAFDTVVLANGTGEIAKLHLGYPGPASLSFYIRKDDLPEVYLVQSDLKKYLEYDLESWRMKPPVEAEPKENADIPAEGSGEILDKLPAPEAQI